MSPTLIVSGIRAGELAASECLYSALLQAPRRYLLRHLGFHDNQDRLHDLFLTITRAILEGRIRNPAALHGYIWATLRIQAVGSIRQGIARRNAVMQIPKEDASPSAEAVLVAEERGRLLRSLMDRLTPRYREVLDRFYLKEQSPETIQRGMHCKAAVYRVLKFRALASLKLLAEAQ